MLRIFIVSSILGYVLVSGRPQGARARRGAVCDDNGFDILSNLGGTPSSLPIPIDVTFLNVPESGYVPGRSYNSECYHMAWIFAICLFLQYEFELILMQIDSDDL